MKFEAVITKVHSIYFPHYAAQELKSDGMTVPVILISLVALTGITVSSANPDSIDLESFDVGRCIRVEYTAPTTGRTTVNLLAADGTVALTADYRKNWGGNPSTGQPWQNIVILNSQIGGSWGTEQHVEDVLTTPGMEMDFKICANDTDFSINFDQKKIATYTYRTPVNTVSKVEFTNQGHDSVLGKLCVVYSAAL